MKRRWFAIWIVCALLFGASSTYVVMNVKENKQHAEQVPSTENSAELPPNLKKVGQAFELIRDQYVEEVEEKQLIEGAIQGMLATLNDPYSVYMDADTANRFTESLESSFEGIGAEVGMQDGKMIIVSPFKNSPAEKAGLKPKDQILKVNGESVDGLDLYEVTLKIRGKKGTKVTLEIAREGVAEPVKIEVVRDEIPIETVNASMKEDGGIPIGYIEVTSFSEHTAADFKKQLKDLESQQMKGLIIDVRGNPGGLLSSVEDMLKELITDHKPFVQIEQRNGETIQYYTTLKERKPYPIVVLIDQGSASASEILAGALHEAEGYPLIGERTFGKGTVQQAIPFSDGSNIKLTMFKWLTPDGNWIHKKGIEPTIEVRQPTFFYTHPLNIETALVKDMNSEQVKIAQIMLYGLGYGPGRLDGFFSEQTEKAVVAFQRQERLPLTGKIDSVTAQKLEEKVMEAIQDEKNDWQLQAALKVIRNQLEKE
jgi:carboxyl-terminal processing protease